MKDHRQPRSKHTDESPVAQNVVVRSVPGPCRARARPTPRPRPGEIAGHLHPIAKVVGRGRSVRGACFATDGSRMVMPSFGVTTGGLNVLHPAFGGLFAAERARAYVIGTARIYPLPFTALSVR